MTRRALLVLAFFAIAALQFAVFPGHRYLTGETQIYVPLLEHLEQPGLLTRDLVAAHPNVTYTAYDEATLLLSEAGHSSIRRALILQQAFFFTISLLGFWLMAGCAELRPWGGLLVAAILGFAALLFFPEPTPEAFAFGAVMASVGLYASGKPLSAGLAGGIAVLYDLRVATPLWLVVIAGILLSRRMRPQLRASLPVLAVFVLLLANLAQLQPGVPETTPPFERTPDAIFTILRFRSPDLWVTHWNWWMWLFYFAALLCVWAHARMNGRLRWLSMGLAVCGALAMPLQWLLWDVAHWSMLPQIAPARTIVYLFIFALLVCSVVAAQWWEKQRWASVVCLCGLFLILTIRSIVSRKPIRDVRALSEWAQMQTWGGSVFLFADAGKAAYPGVFRAEAKRAVWVDWTTGAQASYFDSFADEWGRRWRDTMAAPLSKQHLQQMLELPIDYYVLDQADALRGATPVFTGDGFNVYDANQLRLIPKPLL